MSEIVRTKTAERLFFWLTYPIPYDIKYCLLLTLAGPIYGRGRSEQEKETMLAACQLTVYDYKKKRTQTFDAPALDILTALQLVVADWQFKELTILTCVRGYYNRLRVATPPAGSMAAPGPKLQDKLGKTIDVIQTIVDLYEGSRDEVNHYQITEIRLPDEWANLVQAYCDAAQHHNPISSGLKECILEQGQVVVRQHPRRQLEYER